MKVLCVLLSTYNGEKYILEQLNSIFEQKATDCYVKVYIRDDGSSDNTVDLCNEIAKKNKWDIIVDKGENVGASKSFFKLIQECPKADYYAFCDQDDVWRQGKIEKAAKCLDCKAPTLWISNYDVVDNDLRIIKNKAIVSPETHPLRLIFYNNIPGCVMVFNRELLELVQELKMDDFRMHDILLASIASMLGDIVFDDCSYVSYRQHGDNVVGYGHRRFSILKLIKKGLKWLRNKEDYHLVEFAEKMIQINNAKLDDDIKDELKQIVDYKKNIYNTLRLLGCEYTKNKIDRTTLSVRFKILFHVF